MTSRAVLATAFMGLCLLSGPVGSEEAGSAPPETTGIELPRTAYFVDPSGSPLTLAAGRYRVEPGDASTLRLMTEGGDSFAIAAEVGVHEETLSVPEAVIVATAEDEIHVVLLHPDGSSLDARGSYSPVASREVRDPTAAKLAAGTLSNAYQQRLQARLKPPVPVQLVAATLPVINSVTPTRFTIGDTITIKGRNLQKAEADASINQFNQTGHWVKISNSAAVADGSGLYAPGSFVAIHSWQVNADGTVVTFKTTGISAYWPYRTLWGRTFSQTPAAQGGDRQPCDPGHNYVPSWTTPETVRGRLRLRARDLGNTQANYWALASPSEVEIYDVAGCHPGVTQCFADDSFPNGLPCGWNQCRTYSCN